MKIEYYKKNVYGNELVYIKDERIAQIILRLTGRKTIDTRAMEALTALGHELVQVLP